MSRSSSTHTRVPCTPVAILLFARNKFARSSLREISFFCGILAEDVSDVIVINRSQIQTLSLKLRSNSRLWHYHASTTGISFLGKNLPFLVDFHDRIIHDPWSMESYNPWSTIYDIMLQEARVRESFHLIAPRHNSSWKKKSNARRSLRDVLRHTPSRL